MISEWLKRKTSVEEAEADYMVHDSSLSEEGIPFGFINDQWKALVAQMVDGDELWEFSSSPESWNNLVGRAGIALVRNGEIINCIVTRMN